MQPEIIDYVIVSEYSTTSTQKRVRALINSGLQPYGDLSTCIEGSHIKYVQAMIKYKQPQKEPLT